MADDLFHGFFKGKRVLITGHTGFKGSWLSIWLRRLGAEVTGYSLAPPTVPNHFQLAKVSESMNSITGDIRDVDMLKKIFHDFNPEIVFHFAAQALVRYSYQFPLETLQTNILGTANLLEAIRSVRGVKAAIIVTSDKCYENKEWIWGYRENDSLGGDDPYSCSKACAEMVVHAYRRSYFPEEKYKDHGVGLATTRAGNVIGGGDWSQDRLIPDCIKAILKGETVVIRYPGAVRPWQYLLEPLYGYLRLSRELYMNGLEYSGAWNFGPGPENTKNVRWIVDKIAALWEGGIRLEISEKKTWHETGVLTLDSSKAMNKLDWRPRVDIEKTLSFIIDWYHAYRNHEKMEDFSEKQIADYEKRFCFVGDSLKE